MDDYHHLYAFQGLPATELDWLLSHGMILDLATGDFLMCEGDPAPRFYVTLAGDQCNVEDAWASASTFVDAGFTLASLQEQMQGAPAGQLGAILTWLNSAHLARHLLQEIEQSVTRISNMIGTVKAYTFMDQAPVQPVDIHQGLENTLRVLHNELAGVTVTREFDPTLPVIEARGSELNQIWTSLIDNAIDAMQGQGALALITRNENDYVMVEVADSGAGIPDDVLPRIFEPFFSTKGVGAGVGLGLDMVYHIVTQHGGSIDVQSRPGRTRFIVRLPVDLP